MIRVNLHNPRPAVALFLATRYLGKTYEKALPIFEARRVYHASLEPVLPPKKPAARAGAVTPQTKERAS